MREKEPGYHLGPEDSPAIGLGLGLGVGLDLGSSFETGLSADFDQRCLEGDFAPRESSLAVQDSLTLYGGGRRLVDLLREKSPSLVEAPDLLRRHGFASESAQLERPGLLEIARQYVVEGVVLTPFHPEADWIWERQANLPTALWCAQPRSDVGPVEFPRRLFAVVGSRDVDSLGEQGALAAAKALHQGGWTLVTGGASGVDSLALEGVSATLTPRGVVLHPWGLSCDAGQRLRRKWPWAWHLSLCPPLQDFEGRYAHQRNRIIFALSDGALSISPRFRRGGTWSGAMECLRGRLAPLAFLADSGEPEALIALKNLGAYQVSLSDLEGSGGPDLMGQIVSEGRQRGRQLNAPLNQDSLFGEVFLAEPVWAEEQTRPKPLQDLGRQYVQKSKAHDDAGRTDSAVKKVRESASIYAAA